MTATPGSILVYGYGNPSRGDDGLGQALAAELAELALPRTVVASSYQLEVEDAAELSEYDAVVFVDADISGPEPFSFDRVPEQSWLSFSTHSVTPGSLLSLARELFGKDIPGFILGIRGYAFDHFQESLSLGARDNLERALAFLEQALKRGDLDRYARLHGAAGRQPHSPTDSGSGEGNP